MMRFFNVTAITVCMVFALVSAAYSGSYSGVVNFMDGEVVTVEDIKAMNSKEYSATFITYQGERVQFDEIESIEFPGDADFTGNFNFVITRRDGKRITGWINSEKDYGYMWELSLPGHAAIYKLNKGVQIESGKEIKKIKFEKAD